MKRNNDKITKADSSSHWLKVGLIQLSVWNQPELSSHLTEFSGATLCSRAWHLRPPSPLSFTVGSPPCPPLLHTELCLLGWLPGNSDQVMRMLGDPLLPTHKVRVSISSRVRPRAITSQPLPQFTWQLGWYTLQLQSSVPTGIKTQENLLPFLHPAPGVKMRCLVL